jgi:malate/lactate dehydrogenase
MEVNLIKMGRFMTAVPTIVTSVRISPEFHQLARENGINLTEAVRIGISVILGDKGIKEYDNNLNLFRKMKLFQQELEKVSKEFEAFKQKQNVNEVFQ